ncbi:MAG: hypothetical protein ABI885_18295 [Gammaproteobacteria bacterium]
MTRYTALGAALILATSTAVSADPAPKQQAHVPHTLAAARAAGVLARAERAFTAQLGKQQVSNVWLFPTGDANTVFVKYDVAPGLASAAGAHTQSRLAMLEMQGDRIARLHSFEPLEQLMVAKR